MSSKNWINLLARLRQVMTTGILKHSPELKDAVIFPFNPRKIRDPLLTKNPRPNCAVVEPGSVQPWLFAASVHESWRFMHDRCRVGGARLPKFLNREFGRRLLNYFGLDENQLKDV